MMILQGSSDPILSGKALKAVGCRIPRYTRNLRPKSPLSELGLKGPLGDIDPLTKVPFKRATSRVKKGPLY